MKNWQRIASLGSVCFGALCVPFREFAIDDAFIAYRFSQNLVLGHGLVWNVGEVPIESFSSMLWVLLHAAALSIGLDPLLVSKALGVISALGVVWLLAWRFRDAPTPLALGLVAAVALSANFALLAVQGLETTFAALWCVALVLLPGRLVAWYTVALGAFLTRPDLAPFVAGCWIAVWTRHPRRAVLGWAAFFGAIALTYVGWRWWYFGSWMPHSFDIKSGQGLTGADYVLNFLGGTALPYLGVAAILAFSRARELGNPGACLGAGLFFLGMAFAMPLQGYADRFLWHVFPGLLAALPSGGFAGAARSRVVLAVLGVFLLLVPLRQLPEALRQRDARPVADRIAAGRALADLDGLMLVSEAGALPYYSGWRALDTLGLTSDRIAEGGLSSDTLDELRPDLVMLIRATNQPLSDMWPGLAEWFEARGYAWVARAQKAGPWVHDYFADPVSPLFREIKARLRVIQVLFPAPQAVPAATSD